MPPGRASRPRVAPGQRRGRAFARVRRRWAVAISLPFWCVGVPGCLTDSGSSSPVVLAPPITPGGMPQDQDQRSGQSESPDQGDDQNRDGRPASPETRPGPSGGGGSAGDGDESGPGGRPAGPLSPYTGSMDAHELLTRSAMAYAQLDAYRDRGRIAVGSGGGDGGGVGQARSYAFQTEAAGADAFRFELVSEGPAPVRDLVVRTAASGFEVVRGGRFSKAASVEEAIAPLVADVGPLVAFAPAALFGDDGGALADDYRAARVLGRDRVGGRSAVVLELELVPGLLRGRLGGRMGGRGSGRATVWLDEPTLLVRRVAHTLDGRAVAIEFASMGGP